MMKRVKICLAVFVAVLLAASLAAAAEVAQGKCIQFDKEKMVVLIEEYDINFDKDNPYGHPTGIQSLFNAQKALIGIPPEVGDVLRIAYKIQGDEKIAIRIMNVTKQDLRKK
jgi:hypothetical protein